VYGIRLDGVWMWTPHFGLGGAFTLLTTSPFEEAYGPPGMLVNGDHALAFVEGDLLEGWFTPYARFGFGLANYTRLGPNGSGAERSNGVAELEGGLALRPGPLVLRLSAAPSFYGSDFFVVFGVQLGIRF
jgi:hypothetical protein